MIQKASGADTSLNCWLFFFDILCLSGNLKGTAGL